MSAARRAAVCHQIQVRAQPRSRYSSLLVCCPRLTASWARTTVHRSLRTHTAHGHDCVVNKELGRHRVVCVLLAVVLRVRTSILVLGSGHIPYLISTPRAEPDLAVWTVPPSLYPGSLASNLKLGLCDPPLHTLKRVKARRGGIWPGLRSAHGSKYQQAAGAQRKVQ